MAAELERSKADTTTIDGDVVASPTSIARAKNLRLRLMKARNENYLAERREEREPDEDVTKELSLDYETVNRRA
ncbi:MAG: hypothetical protein ABI868_02265 [Acidobacteriota bacterium]